MKNPVLTIGGFVVSAILLAMALIMVASINLVLNGFHQECGLWSAVPFACDPKPAVRYMPPARTDAAMPARSAFPKPRPKAPPAKAVIQHPAETGNCAPLQREPARMQCDGRACYYDPGFRATCGLADNWGPGR